MSTSAPPDWSQVREPDADDGSGPAGIAIRAGLGVAVVALLWLLGRHLSAIVLAAGLVLATGLSLRVPAVARALQRSTRVIQHGAGRVLTFLLLAVLQLLVFTPLSLILRVLRIDPLRIGTAVDPRSLWLATTSDPQRPLYARQFAYERAGDQSMPRGGATVRRLRLAAGLLAVLILTDVAIGAVIHAGDQVVSNPAAANLSLLPSATVPAARHEPWAATLGRELGHEYYNQRPDPYLSWRMPDYRSRYVNVSDGVRRSWQGPLSTSPRAVTVFFFGGSALFGVFQRDEETIPSDFARLAAAAGIPVRVWNFGGIGYVNWQEVLRFEQLVAAGRTPALAVFYDGANELLTQFRLGPHTTPSHPEAAAIDQLLPYAGVTPPRTGSGTSPLSALYHAWANESAVSWLLRRLRGEAGVTPLTLPPWAGSQSANATRAGADTALVYQRGVGLARRIGTGYGVRTAFFWQPILYSKRRLAGELPPESLLGTEPAAWTRAYAIARSRLRTPVIDVAGALNSVTTPVMYDFVHTNELGARVVSADLFGRLAGTLRTLRSRP